ncbi:hypothetical protein J2S14_001389 [Lederbergia wuyishanensis]|uniref:Uncharacterized protein n=1 Tax=Lederbergia wuyishanensis TaxID=1347903 RepID=A0ABU0D2E3_9BACI|nr:hypothetical protein [Lederbergia wuyishanensis]
MGFLLKGKIYAFDEVITPTFAIACTTIFLISFLDIPSMP